MSDPIFILEVGDKTAALSMRDPQTGTIRARASLDTKTIERLERLLRVARETVAPATIKHEAKLYA